ncbi:MAG TPA: HEXXH motif-containing putative peptide modification protein [Myxococcota bacterium]|nr:HEXXH motif-containing putative peptide modification protein [Myxococcota bacterium]
MAITQGDAFFAPSEARARRLDAHMRARLAGSVRYLASQVGGALEVPADALSGLLGRLDAGPVSPHAFAAYADLVLALEADDASGAQQHLLDLFAAPAAPDGPRILALGDPARDRDAARYRRRVDSDPGQPLAILPPPPAVAVACRARLEAALARLDRGDPALAGEIRALLREIVLAVGSSEPDAWTFDGASSFLLWGAVVLNAAEAASVLATIQAVAHESAHNLLFGLSADGPLVLNGDLERFSSPLRVDPRPLDGIFHATFVTARMQQAVGALRAAGALLPEERDEAEHALSANAALFAQGLATLDRHAKLTPLGESVLAGARAVMAREAW